MSWICKYCSTLGRCQRDIARTEPAGDDQTKSGRPLKTRSSAPLNQDAVCTSAYAPVRSLVLMRGNTGVHSLSEAVPLLPQLEIFALKMS